MGFEHVGRPAHRRLAPAVSIAAALLLGACGSDDPPRGAVTGSTEVATLTRSAIDQAGTASGLQALSGPALCDVSIRQITYLTVGARGERFQSVSGALLVPGGAGCSGPYPLVAYSKGTDVIRARTLASATDSETGILVGMLAARGYAVVAPDYLGYAKSDYPFHPYLHAESEASVNVDAIRAARSLLGSALDGRVMLTGYSQGGHASMAAQRALERAPDGIRLVAAGHSSGPYDLTGSFLAGLAALPTGTGGSTVFVPFALTGFQRIYGDVYTSPDAAFKAPYATGIESLLPGTASTQQLIAGGRLPANLGDLVTDRTIADLREPQSGLRRALAANTLLDFAPTTPTLLCGGARDPVVVFQNAANARAAFQAAGATVTVVDVEQVPAFAAQFPATLSPAQLSAYHGATVPPLCLAVVRDQLFEPARTR